MADPKRKARGGASSNGSTKKQKTGSSFRSDDKPLKRRGPRLPNQFRKVLDGMNHRKRGGGDSSDSDEDERIDFEETAMNDAYEYEEEVPEEESRKNRRFDPVETLEYETPDEFEDENISSDDESIYEDASEDEENEDDRHARMLNELTGIPGEAFKGKKKDKNAIITEAYPESEFNPTRDVLDGSGQITINDLLAPLQHTSGYAKLKKKIDRLEKKVAPTEAPLHRAEQERLDRKAAYITSKRDMVKWEPLIKRNREAPTLIFDNDVDIGFSTVGAIASEFEPRTEFEKKMASLISSDKVADAHSNDGARLLELNEVTIEDERERRGRIAKMRSLLFSHEVKAKRLKKIKSKTYHRLLKKDRLKKDSEALLDPEAAKELARKHDFERAKERMTLRHKRSSKWFERIKQRGVDVQDEGTRAAIAEKDQLHTALTRKIRSMKDSSSSSDGSDSDDDSDYNSSGSEQDRSSRLISKAKEKTLKVMNEEDEVPQSGLLALPFMVRGMKKREEAAAEEARLALEDFDSLSKQLDGSKTAGSPKSSVSSGRMVFNAAGKQALKSSKCETHNKSELDRFYDHGDSEDDFEADDNDNDVTIGNAYSQSDVNIDSSLLNNGSSTNQDSLLKSFDDIGKDPGPKTTHEVAIFASGSWKKAKGENNDASVKKPPVAKKRSSKNPGPQETAQRPLDHSNSDSETEMVDGILSSGPRVSYELPSQAELIREAFAADDVEDDFERLKQEALNEENPEPKEPSVLPGWGQWTRIQKKRGPLAWMVKEYETAKSVREEAVKKRKDAHLKHVVISERLDKRTEKLYTKTLPFPYTSKEVYEQSIRMPIGPEYNPATTVAALNRPEILKKPGQIIKPIEFEEVDPNEKGEMQRHGGTVERSKNTQKQRQKLKQKKKNKSES